MKPSSVARAALIAALLATAYALPAAAAPAEATGEIHIDVPVALKQAKVVFNMDHAAFGGDTPVGLAHMTMMVERFKQNGTKWKMTAIFHGEAGYMLLNDETYNAVRKTKTGNPYKSMILNLISQGVEVEECAVTMKGNKWTNANLLPGVKVDSGADGRIIELVQQGYVMLQP
ncbi:DsrE family protein [Rhodoferax sp. BAB1]|jgi:intracellular sulfur oxidation DsrE/DsrF family protein|uniref:DsrE family protein n=1 Tax=Rhodoferax sp. BAB1 TaxID=2741720 RepID=UPI0015750333|nr:DsrE family protein [Rhodoferax sp. BAB1]QKO20576.1 DsrE family protein [Rhodoferax sp. BAB1]